MLAPPFMARGKVGDKFDFFAPDLIYLRNFTTGKFTSPSLFRISGFLYIVFSNKSGYSFVRISRVGEV